MKLSKAGARICSIEEQKVLEPGEYTNSSEQKATLAREERDGPSTHVRTYTLGSTQDMLSTEQTGTHTMVPGARKIKNVGTIRILKDHYWFHRNLNWLRVPLCCHAQILRGLSCGRDLGAPSRVLVR